LQCYSLVGPTYVYTTENGNIRYRARIEAGCKAKIFNPDRSNATNTTNATCADPGLLSSSFRQLVSTETDFENETWFPATGFEFSHIKIEDYAEIARLLYTDDWQSHP